ncbi:uncharacterized protein DUF2516 [Stackebrandtia albiflava]|uniref:Uncharacterized protein DUF2516 n=1 Tax=Stackebrandtia albiflava TaxID=406432 RepID=A0A562UYR0_9ACTN|nr:DUF2516 family protein [Stackebrandtia albiflava]TWJ10743.1 uncharacterized protein DUF2516 [Stackebrandtia albiflava]
MNAAHTIEFYSTLVITSVCSLLSLVALVHCAIQRPDAFSAAGPLSKGAWLAILGGTLLLTALGFGGGTLGLFGIIGLIASLVYLLDIRRALRGSDGNSW